MFSSFDRRHFDIFCFALNPAGPGVGWEELGWHEGNCFSTVSLDSKCILRSWYFFFFYLNGASLYSKYSRALTFSKIV